MHQISDIIGLVGIVFIIAAYFLLQINKLRASSLTYSVMNAAGASAIMVSLFYAWNLSAFLIELFWLILSVFGIVRYFLSAGKRG